MKCIKIKRWIHDGNDTLSNSVNNTDELLEAAADSLDSACSWDIVGPILFMGEDGQYYVGTVDFSISKAHPDYVKQELE